METTKQKIQVEVWSDIMCPFCYIGKRNYEAALKQFPKSEQVEIVWKSFQLNPNIPEETDKKKNVYQYLSEIKGISYEQAVQMNEGVTQTAKRAGLDYHFDKVLVVNSFRAHRVIQFAKSKGLGDAAEERFFYANFTEGKDYSNLAVLKELGKDIGLTEDEVNEALTNSKYAEAVQEDIREAQELGIHGVPFFVFNRKFAVSGAQPPETFVAALGKAFAG